MAQFRFFGRTKEQKLTNESDDWKQCMSNVENIKDQLQTIRQKLDYLQTELKFTEEAIKFLLGHYLLESYSANAIIVPSSNTVRIDVKDCTALRVATLRSNLQVTIRFDKTELPLTSFTQDGPLFVSKTVPVTSDKVTVELSSTNYVWILCS